MYFFQGNEREQLKSYLNARERKTGTINSKLVSTSDKEPVFFYLVAIEFASQQLSQDSETLAYLTNALTRFVF